MLKPDWSALSSFVARDHLYLTANFLAITRNLTKIRLIRLFKGICTQEQRSCFRDHGWAKIHVHQLIYGRMKCSPEQFAYAAENFRRRAKLL